MSDVVRARVRGFEKNIGRDLAESTEGIEIIDDEPTHTPDGRVRPPVKLAAVSDPESGYAANTVAELQAEVERRNDARGDGEALVVVEGKGNKPDLIKALEAHDNAQGGTQ